MHSAKVSIAHIIDSLYLHPRAPQTKGGEAGDSYHITISDREDLSERGRKYEQKRARHDGIVPTSTRYCICTGRNHGRNQGCGYG